MTEFDFIILYGSETGTAQDFAYSLAHKCRYLNLNPLVCSMDSLDLKLLFEVKTLLLVCSTTGQGELPRNCRKFFKFLMQRKLPKDFLEHLSFSTCGLGDSSYVFYNLAIRKFHARIKQLGAKELCERVECDEQSSQGQESFFDSWEKLVFHSLKLKYINKIDEIPATEILEPVFKLKINEVGKKTGVESTHSIDDKDIEKVSNTEISLPSSLERTKNLTKVKIEKIDRITSPNHFQEVIHIRLKDPESRLNYHVGDTISLYPENDPKNVQSFINLQDWKDIADSPITLVAPEHLDPEAGWVKNLTLRALLTYHLDIMAVPPRSFFQLVWHFASDERESEKLLELSKIEESQQLYNYVNRPHRSILEVIQEFFTLKIPIDQLLECIPLIKPRLFSICNFPDKSLIELTVAVVEYSTVIRRLRKGLCTSWLKRLNSDDEIIISINHNNLKIPNSDMILVGPGTGIAPVRAIVQYNDKKHREAHGGHGHSHGHGHNYLMFTGHRHKEKDYLYGEEWPTMKGLDVINSFSRQGGGYVQDTIWKNKDKVSKILKNGGGLYLCGSSGKMPTQVRITIEQILKESNGWDEETTKKEMLRMEKEKKYIQETW